MENGLKDERQSAFKPTRIQPGLISTFPKYPIGGAKAHRLHRREVVQESLINATLMKHADRRVQSV